jgi:hypothetical protein
MLYTYGTITYDLGGLPRSLQDRLDEDGVTDALHAYLDAYMAYKAAIDENDAYEYSYSYSGLEDKKAIQLLRACQSAQKHRNKMWSALTLLLDEDSDEE